MDKKVLLQDLADGVARKRNIPKKDAENFLRVVFDVIGEFLQTDKIVKVRGLGTFKLVTVDTVQPPPKKMRKNPMTPRRRMFSLPPRRRMLQIPLCRRTFPKTSPKMRTAAWRKKKSSNFRLCPFSHRALRWLSFSAPRSAPGTWDCSPDRGK